jgi:hypothetical protein
VGRPEHAVWRGYEILTVDGAKSGKCRGCGKVIGNNQVEHHHGCFPCTNTYRLRRHVLGCEAQHDLRAKLVHEQKPPKQIELAFKPCNKTLQQQLARAVFSLNLPFCAVEGGQFRKLMQTCSPGMPFVCAFHFTNFPHL